MGLVFDSAPARADGHAFKISFQNDCWQSVQVALNYRHLDGDWGVRGWYDIPPGETCFLAESKNRIYYYHAQSDGTDWSGKDRFYKVRNKPVSYGFREVRIDRETYGEWTSRLTCDDALPYKIRIANNCGSDLNVALRYVDPDSDEWRTRGYFVFSPGERGSITSTRNSIIYLHGGRGDKYYVGPDMREYRVRGNDEKFFRVDMKDEGPTQTFKC
ncbi:hypothetical protein AIOL_002389 [Candidatus Rhodobacter oscarellae]|uniref:Uncharacterized protein n=2 Tax=Candidatus Rhodobacter oscarellae TaxID=1675527 RepID=A0A0J9E3P8_9RHOB|nr:hypothetical protein AIOL_002389 [Candidatus Rhodobacter lobularis]